jgi:cytochrome c oxidase subunit II
MRSNTARGGGAMVGALSAIACPLLLVGCGSGWPASAAGPEAARIAALWWVFACACIATYVLTMAFLIVALVRHRHAGRAPGTQVWVPSRDEDKSLAWSVSIAVGVSAAVLLGLLIADFVTGRALSADSPSEALQIDVVGHQFWWEATYPDAVASNQFSTANELHIPVGRRIVLNLTSADVIHSFWVPWLQGKRDLIPGYATTLVLQADVPGTYAGQCAEFCGYQHAHMRLAVIAETPERFAQWQRAQREPARPASSAAERRGQEVLLALSCVLCHTIQGTRAAGKVAPDLTHLASRQTIAAGTLPNTRGHLAGWILNPQSIKPGAKMPPTPLGADDLQALLSYLESLT